MCRLEFIIYHWNNAGYVCSFSMCLICCVFKLNFGKIVKINYRLKHLVYVPNTEVHSGWKTGWKTEFLAHLWGAYAIPVASYVVCFLCPT